MPIYEYVCEHCENKFEENRSIKIDSSVTKCTKCGKEAKKIISSGAFHLKGGGWYKDGYSSKKVK